MSKSKDNILSSNDLNNLSSFHQKRQKGWRRRMMFRVMSIKLMSQTHVLESMWWSSSNKGTMRFRRNLASLKLLDDVFVDDLDVWFGTIVWGFTFGCYYAPTRPNSTPSFVHFPHFHHHQIFISLCSFLQIVNLVYFINFIYFGLFILYPLLFLMRNL